MASLPFCPFSPYRPTKPFSSSTAAGPWGSGAVVDSHEHAACCNRPTGKRLCAEKRKGQHSQELQRLGTPLQRAVESSWDDPAQTPSHPKTARSPWRVQIRSPLEGWKVYGHCPLPFSLLGAVTPPAQAGLCHTALRLVSAGMCAQEVTVAQLPGRNSIGRLNVRRQSEKSRS